MFRNLLIIVAVFGLGWGGSFAAGMTYGQRQAALASPVGAGGSRERVQSARVRLNREVPDRPEDPEVRAGRVGG